MDMQHLWSKFWKCKSAGQPHASTCSTKVKDLAEATWTQAQGSWCYVSYLKFGLKIDFWKWQHGYRITLHFGIALCNYLIIIYDENYIIIL